MKWLGIIITAAALTGCASPAPREPTQANANAGQGDPAREVAVPPPEPAPARPAAAAPVEPPAQPSAASEYRDVFPHVRFDAKTKAVAFDGVVPINAHDAKSPWVFLEVVVCMPDTKEHEALVVTQAKASHVHAALLLAGLAPGKPGRWKFENTQLHPVNPEGEEVRVTLSYVGADGSTKTFRPEEMVVHAQSGRRFGEAGGRPGKWVFAGSQIVTRAGREWYDADGAGTLVGLTTFGSETVAWSEIISHEAGLEEPVWIADSKTTPPAGTPITVTIRRVE